MKWKVFRCANCGDAIALIHVEINKNLEFSCMCPFCENPVFLTRLGDTLQTKGILNLDWGTLPNFTAYISE